MKKYMTILLLPALLAGCSHPGTDPGNAGEPPIPVKTIALTRQTVREPVVASGTFTTDDEAVRSFKTGGVIRQVLVREGDAVRKGQLLAVLDLTEVGAQVTQAELAFAKAERDFKRVQSLFADSVVTLEQLQNAQTGLDMAREQLTAARFNQSYSEIRATEDGFVLRKFVNEGQVVGPGTPVLQTNGAGDGDWILRVAVSDGQWSCLEKGDSATIVTDLPGMSPVQGTVTKRSEGIDPYSGTFTIDIKPAENLNRRVASGMFGKAAITPSGGREVWTIPYDALLDGDGNHGFVFVTPDGKRAEKRKVSLAGITRDHVLVDGGLEDCTRLIISGSAYLSDGAAIRAEQ